MLKQLPNKIPNRISKQLNQVGFTLIELLVVVMVISALSGIVISLINSGGFRDKAKDGQRIADLKQLQTALELYFADNRAYPVSASWTEISGVDALSAALSPAYINKIPVANNTVTGFSTPCDNQATQRYTYITTATGTSYILAAVMALDSSAADQACNSLTNWGVTGSCVGDSIRCYGVQNP
ncbi:prepilin-type N-terminal cleavage/methylation domain-containing protein [candidate division WWE3 bacterium]|nr:prepilin-type N-terminal cleavage/methylation domain-containing protein [candidate division WWE3 bacterium]